MRATLEVELPDGRRRAVVVEDRATLGRGLECGVALPFAGISREHAEVAFDGARWTLRDFESRNGSFVNDLRVETSAALRDGDRVRVGPIQMTFRLGSAAPDPAITSVIVESEPTVKLGNFPPARRVGDRELLERDYDLLRAAHALSQAIGDVRDADGVIRVILSFCLEQLDADQAVVLRRAGEEFVVSGAISRTTSADAGTGGPTEVGVSRTILHAMCERAEGVLVMDATAELAASASVAALGIASVLAVPLVREKVVIGAIVVDNRARRSAFSRHDLRVLTGIAAQSSLALERAELLREVAAEGERRGRLSRFLAPELVDRVVRGELTLEPGGREGTVAVLYCDIRDFTPLSSRLGPSATMAMLNEYFEALVPLVFAHGGMVDKFVGDELMAVWGAQGDRPDDLARALRCAIAIQRKLVELAALRVGRGELPIACGVGVNAGPALVGLLGLADRMQYTVIGDTVNVGARLCGQAAAGEVVTRTELLAGWTGEPFGPPQPTPVKGVAAPILLSRLRV